MANRNKKVWNKSASALVEALASLDGEQEMKRFLSDLLSESEIREFARRWQAAEMLYQGYPYSEIETETGLSSATIARVSRCVAGASGGYRVALERTFGSTAAAVNQS